MNKIHNLKFQKKTRKYLRNNMTKAEIILWSKLKGKQLMGYKFRRQHGIGKYIVDFYCPELKLIIEIDGETHDCNNQVKDETRQKFIENLEFVVKRYTNDDIIKNLNGVLENLGDAINSIALSSTTPSPSLSKEGRD